MSVATVQHGWSGDLRDFSIRFWWDESEIAAIAVANGRVGAGWFNLKHVHPPVGRIVARWCTHAAYHRAPWAVLYADELAELVALLDAEQRPAEAEE